MATSYLRLLADADRWVVNGELRLGRRVKVHRVAVLAAVQEKREGLGAEVDEHADLGAAAYASFGSVGEK